MAELLRRKIAATFASSSDRHSAESLLATFPEDAERIALAALKLSDGSIQRLQHFGEAADVDSRDVLAWAECPSEANLAAGASAVEKAKVQEADSAAYRAWLQA